MENYKGTVLYHDEATAIQTVKRWKQLLPEIKKVGDAYTALDSAFSFSQEVFNDIIKNRILNITTDYTKKVDQQIKQMKFTSAALVDGIRNNISKDLQMLSANIENLFKRIAELNSSGSGITAPLPIDLNQYKIIDGQPMLDENAIENITKQFSIIVETERQNLVYNAMIVLKNSYEELATLVSADGRNHFRSNPLISNSTGCFLTLEANELSINAHALKAI